MYKVARCDAEAGRCAGRRSDAGIQGHWHLATAASYMIVQAIHVGLVQGKVSDKLWKVFICSNVAGLDWATGLEQSGGTYMMSLRHIFLWCRVSF
jgi:hypothetical protein